jgi:hypothetical protein
MQFGVILKTVCLKGLSTILKSVPGDRHNNTFFSLVLVFESQSVRAWICCLGRLLGCLVAWFLGLFEQATRNDSFVTLVTLSLGGMTGNYAG